jgi:hypothetical protein
MEFTLDIARINENAPTNPFAPQMRARRTLNGGQLGERRTVRNNFSTAM